MRRFAHLKTNERPFYHFYGRFRDGYLEDLEGGWNYYCQVLNDLKFEVNAFVMMTNHFHGVLRLQGQQIEDLRKAFPDLEGGLQLIRITNSKALRETLIYVYKNPVKAGIVERELDFEYSTYFQTLRPKEHSGLIQLSNFKDPLHLILRPNLPN